MRRGIRRHRIGNIAVPFLLVLVLLLTHTTLTGLELLVVLRAHLQLITTLLLLLPLNAGGALVRYSHREAAHQTTAREDELVGLHRLRRGDLRFLLLIARELLKSFQVEGVPLRLVSGATGLEVPLQPTMLELQLRPNLLRSTPFLLSMLFLLINCRSQSRWLSIKSLHLSLSKKAGKIRRCG